jgi:hypothetical protein
MPRFERVCGYKKINNFGVVDDFWVFEILIFGVVWDRDFGNSCFWLTFC